MKSERTLPSLSKITWTPPPLDAPMICPALAPVTSNGSVPAITERKLDVGTDDHCLSAFATSSFAVALSSAPSDPWSV